MSYICSVCGKSVTPAAHQYCISNQYPVMCHKHQQEYGLNAYHVASDLEIQINKEEAEKEAAERQTREVNRLKNVIANIEYFVNKIIVNKEYGYAKSLFREIELAKKNNLITVEQYNKYIEIYYKNKDKKPLTQKQKSTFWKEIIVKIEAIINENVKTNKIESDFAKEDVYSQMNDLIDEYQFIETNREEYLYVYLKKLQEITESYYYEDAEEIKFGFKM
jgi:hypothetical protein